MIDVGVGYGTWPLYDAYPSATFLLVEPIADFECALRDIASKVRCEFCFKAVGETPGRYEIVVDKLDLQKSSFNDRSQLTRRDDELLERRIVEMTTLDAIFSERAPLQAPIVLKLDTEGHELSALRGARKLLRETEYVIAEVSIARRFEGSYRFEEVVEFMDQQGFSIFSFLQVAQARGEMQPRFVDVVFHRTETKSHS